jgi:hypothetical protein
VDKSEPSTEALWCGRDRHSKEALHDILRAISKHGLGDSVSVNLLHKHFDLYPDEVLVEVRRLTHPVGPVV